MIARQFHGRTSLPTSPVERFKVGLSGTAPTLICSAPELAALTHMPNQDSISVTGINYAKSLVDGTLPPDSKDFEPLTDKEMKEATKTS
jgi:hypothetical protein